jgi:hypothetical protein
MTLVYNKKLGDVVPHRILGYHDYQSITDMTDYIIRTEEDAEDAQTFGFEIEVSKESRITDSIIEKVFEIFPWCQIESDSSIPNYGMEIITAPFTLKAAYELPFKELFDYLKSKNIMAYGVTSTDNGNGCGGHIHMSKGDKWDDITALMAMFLDQNKEIVQVICKRPFTSYARNNLTNLYNSSRRYCLPTVKEYVLSNSDEHSNILNLQHSRTIEFRLPIGTLNYNTKMAHLEFIANLYKCCEDVVTGKARVDRLTINKVCQDGKFLPNYMRDLCISCSRKLTILDSEFKKQIKEIDVKKVKLIKILSNLQYELATTRDCGVRQGSINTINRYFNNVSGANNLESLIYAIQSLKAQTVLSSGLDEYVLTHTDKIAQYYNQFKEYVNSVEIDNIYYDIREEM